MGNKKQHCTLKVNINCCNDCEVKVYETLLKIHGVDDVSLDLVQDQVIVVGDVDPKKLIRKLDKLGMPAEIISTQRGGNEIEVNNDGRKKGGFLGKVLGFGKKSRNIGEGSSSHVPTTIHHGDDSNRNEDMGEMQPSSPSSISPSHVSTTPHDRYGYGYENIGQMQPSSPSSSHVSTTPYYGYGHEYGYENMGQMQPSSPSSSHVSTTPHDGYGYGYGYGYENMGQMQPSSSHVSTTPHHGYGYENMGQQQQEGMNMPIQPSSYDQQHYMDMMNQQLGNMNIHPPNTYGEQYPSMNYMPPPPSHPNYGGQYSSMDPTHDENAEGCWIM
ncbi:hypothetical protein P8452_33550 [Trifolium repens]|nr:hypothetical protein P8452_33550 [Trifolium repens]